MGAGGLTIGDYKMPDDGAIIDWLAVPLAGDRIGVDRERIVRGIGGSIATVASSGLGWQAAGYFVVRYRSPRFRGIATRGIPPSVASAASTDAREPRSTPVR